mgnify:CR=1 FL=1
MLLTFKRESFVQEIIEGTKIHTLRPDPNDRWKPHMKIHFWKGNPRNVKQNPYFFGNGIVFETPRLHLYDDAIEFIHMPASIYKPELRGKELDRFARNDGFKDWKAMKLWFPGIHKNMKLIFWSDFEFKIPPTSAH